MTKGVSRPLLDLALQLVTVATLVPGGYALLHPALTSLFGEQDARIGLPGGTLTFLVAVVPFFGGWYLVRVRRHRFTTQQTALLGMALAIGYAVLLAIVQARWRGSDAFVAMSSATAWTLVLLGMATQGVASWIKRSRWR